jgi:GNAT superfamily N-acetyltransferase
MIIRLATAADKEQILKLLDELGTEINLQKGLEKIETEAQEVGAPILDEILQRKDTLIFVADDNTTLLGLVTFYILPIIRHGWHRGHIEDVVVRETARGQGVGTQMFDAIKKYCKDSNIKVIKLDSGLELEDAHRFYEKNGGKFTEKMFRFDL